MGALLTVFLSTVYNTCLKHLLKTPVYNARLQHSFTAFIYNIYLQQILLYRAFKGPTSKQYRVQPQIFLKAADPL